MTPCLTGQEPLLRANLIDLTMMMAKINQTSSHPNLDLQPHPVSASFLHKLGVMKTILLVGLCLRSWMVSDVFGRGQQCIQEMVTGFSLQNGSPKTGRKVNWMVSFSSEEDSFPRRYLRSRKDPRSIQSGKM